jgi:hypothetical protein
VNELTRARRPPDRILIRQAAPELEANVTEPTVVRDAETGKPVFVLARYGGDLGRLRRAARAYPPTTTYRMAGTRNVSRTFGYSATRAPMRRSSCRACSGAVDAAAAHAAIAGASTEPAADPATHLPERAARDLLRATDVIRSDWFMGGWWTSGVVNFNSPLPYHYDANNLDCWSAMPVMRRGVKGGHLHVPEYDLVVGCRDGDVCFFAGYDLMHATTPLRYTTRDAYRISAVYYTVAGMAKCADPGDELAIGRARQSDAETNMRARQEEAGLL